MSGFTPNLALGAECERQRRIAEWQQAMAQNKMQGPALGGQMSLGEQYRQSALSQQAQNMQPVQHIQQAMMQALGALAVLSERSRCVAMGESLIGIGAFGITAAMGKVSINDTGPFSMPVPTGFLPLAEPVVVAASKPVNPALARAMGCGSRQALGFMVR